VRVGAIERRGDGGGFDITFASGAETGVPRPVGGCESFP